MSCLNSTVYTSSPLSVTWTTVSYWGVTGFKKRFLTSEDSQRNSRKLTVPVPIEREREREREREVQQGRGGVGTKMRSDEFGVLFRVITI